MDQANHPPRYLITSGITPHGDFEMQQMPQFFEKNGDHPFQPHIHSFYQIIWFKNGLGKHYVDFHDYPVTANTLFFISPGQIHWFEQNKNFEGFIIHFSENFLSDEGQSDNVFLKYNIFNAFDANPSFHVCETCALILSALLRNLQDELNHQQDFAHVEYLNYLVKLFLIQVQRMGKREDSLHLQPTNHVHRTFVKFRQMIENHYRLMHTTKEYANYMNITTKTLYNNVMEVAHVTPLQMIDDRIILEAKRKLCHTSMKVKEISYYLGFDDPSYFVKFFKKKVGCIPLEFRNINANEIIAKKHR